MAREKKIKVVLGLSGGVDSAVSAYLLKKQGFDVSCVYLNCFDSDTPGCRGDNDRKDALAVAMQLELPFQVLDFRKEYQSAVIDYFKKEYLAGRTPNPDVVCNRDIKFGLLLDWCIKNGFEYLATGHYAALRHSERSVAESRNPGRPRRPILIASLGLSTRVRSLETTEETEIFLIQPRDLHKDQTYFLWAVPWEKFNRVLFPLGDYLKSEVREIARKIGLPVAEKKDSTGICFVGEVRVEDFLKRLGVREKPGDVVIRTTIDDRRWKMEDGKNRADRSIFNHLSSTPILHPPSSILHFKVIGRHRGVWFYTIGQRHGFSVNQWPPKTNVERRTLNVEKNNAQPSTPNDQRSTPVAGRPPLYVIAKDVRRNRLIVGFGAETYREKFVVGSCNWLVNDKFFSQTQNSKLKTQNLGQSSKPEDVFVRIRHGGDLVPCRLLSVNSRKLEVALATPARGIAPGQSAVFYTRNGLVLGGGVIR